MYIVLAVAIVCNLLSFYFGAKITQKVYEHEKLGINIEPKEIREHKKEMQIQAIQEENDNAKNMRNIDKYNGDETGQEDF